MDGYSSEPDSFQECKRRVAIIESSDSESDYVLESSEVTEPAGKSLDVGTCLDNLNNLEICPKNLSSFENGSENDSLLVDASEDKTSACGDYDLANENIQIKTRHIGILSEDEISTQCSTSRSENIYTPKFARQLDFDSWLKKKTIIKQNKSQNFQKSSNDNSEFNQMKESAWINWMCRKKRQELKLKEERLNALKLEQQLKKERRMIAQKVFEDWMAEKDKRLMDEKQKSNVVTETSHRKLKKKFSREVKFDEWCSQKKAKAVPKHFSHVNYPKPTWVNPIPWQNPDVPTDPKQKRD